MFDDAGYITSSDEKNNKLRVVGSGIIMFLVQFLLFSKDLLS